MALRLARPGQRQSKARAKAAKPWWHYDHLSHDGDPPPHAGKQQSRGGITTLPTGMSRRWLSTRKQQSRGGITTGETLAQVLNFLRESSKAVVALRPVWSRFAFANPLEKAAKPWWHYDHIPPLQFLGVHGGKQQSRGGITTVRWPHFVLFVTLESSKAVVALRHEDPGGGAGREHRRQQSRGGITTEGLQGGRDGHQQESSKAVVA